ncbi:MAG: glycosyltransferase family 2 protein [Pseudomonadota bacterium]
MKISVVTPSYNQGSFIRRTIESVLTQTHENVEYIIVDGDSEDETRSILESYRSQLTHLVIEPDAGQADALKKGFELATGDILCYLNSDDVFLPNALQWVNNYFLQNSSVDAVYTDRIFLDQEDRLLGFWILPPHNSYLMSRWDFIPQETCFWRKELMYVSGGIDKSFAFAMDYDLFVRMMKKGAFKHVSRFTAAFRVHAESKTSSLYESVGRPEVERVRREQEIHLNWLDKKVLKAAFGLTIFGTSKLYALVKLGLGKREVRLEEFSR